MTSMPADGGTGARLGYRAAQLLVAVIGVGWAILVPLYVQARVILGHWPKKNLDDPKYLDLSLDYEIGILGFWAESLGTLALIALVLLVALFARRGSSRTFKLALPVIVVSVFLHRVVAVWYLD